jgi:hypothetical protein
VVDGAQARTARYRAAGAASGGRLACRLRAPVGRGLRGLCPDRELGRDDPVPRRGERASAAPDDGGAPADRDRRSRDEVVGAVAARVGAPGAPAAHRTGPVTTSFEGNTTRARVSRWTGSTWRAGSYVDVWVLFGKPTPTRAQLRRAQSELERAVFTSWRIGRH